MFDDIPVNSTKGTTPSNLPLGEPEDMFSAVEDAIPASGDEQVPLQPNPSMGEDRSPFANTSAVSAGILKPKNTATPQPQNYDEHLDALVAPEMAQETAPRGSRMIFIIIASICVIALLSGVVYAIYAFIFAPESNEVEPGIIAPTTTVNQVNTTSSNITADQVIDEEIEREVLFGEAVDTDMDGIDDGIEQTIGTNPQIKDTDNDGLSDGDEILVWKTNPLNPDTDGDGYTDGVEVGSGYSPLGPGKLFTVVSSTPTSASSTTEVNSTNTTTTKL